MYVPIHLNSSIHCTKIFVRYVFRQHNARNVGQRHTDEHRKRKYSVYRHFVTQTDTGYNLLVNATTKRTATVI